MWSRKIKFSHHHTPTFLLVLLCTSENIFPSAFAADGQTADEPSTLSQSECGKNGDGGKDGKIPPEKPKRHRGPDKKPRKRGSMHGNYIHGLGKTRGIDSQTYAAWKEGVMQQTDFRCFVTGEKNKNLLTCHHLNSWDSFPDQRYDISNGVTLTKEIHRAFHKEYGSGKNTKEQFEKFLQERYQIFQYPWQNDNHEPPLSVEEVMERRASQQDRHREEILSLIDSREHVLLSANDGFFVKSTIEIYCPRHDTTNQGTVKKYKYCRTGLRCCGRQAQSDKGSWEHVNKARREAKKSREGENGL